MNKYYIIFLGIFLLSSCEEPTDTKSIDESNEHRQYDLALKDKLTPFKPLPSQSIASHNAYNYAKVDLGKKLYFDKRLSKEGNISCNSCHDLSKGGVDKLPFSPGDDGTLGGRNSPTVLNASFHSTQFWDGRAKDVEEQAGMPILNPVEMAIPNEEFLVQRLKKIEGYKDLFAKAFPENPNVNYTNIRKAIALFERQLITPSRWDKYLEGDNMALSVSEKKGLSSFIGRGCATCHKGALLGGDNFQKFGVYADYWEHTKSAKVDNGKMEVTNDSMDLFIFKVPSLRNIEKTGPYFHDGSVSSLEEAVRIMAKVQLDKNLDQRELKNMVAFLNALSGDLPTELTTAPKLPE